MTPDQVWSNRPIMGYAAYRGPIAGLYHCVAGAHPGGGVTGQPGRNAADRSGRQPRPRRGQIRGDRSRRRGAEPGAVDGPSGQSDHRRFACPRRQDAVSNEGIRCAALVPRLTSRERVAPNGACVALPKRITASTLTIETRLSAGCHVTRDYPAVRTVQERVERILEEWELVGTRAR